MKCPECGAYAGDQDAFCGECGRPLNQEPPAFEAGLPAADSGLPAAAAGFPSDPQDASGERLLLVPPMAAPTVTAPVPEKKTPPWVMIILLGFVALGLLCALVAGLVIWLGMRESAERESVELQPVSGALLYEDDFDNQDGGWDIYEEDDTWAGYLDGEYGLGVYHENYMTWANPGDEMPPNIDIEVDARHGAGPLDNNLGVLARYQYDDDTYYWFQISSDGYYSVDLKQGQDWTTLVAWEESDAINQGQGATNHLRVICDGDWFSFYVNGTHLTDVSDSTLGSGTIGLAVGTFDEPGVEIYFDNLKIRSLQE